MIRWVIEVKGAPGMSYAGETYQLQVDFPEHYPVEAITLWKRLRLLPSTDSVFFFFYILFFNIY